MRSRKKGCFREFALDGEAADIESRLPGIYWCQWISEQMAACTGTVEEISKNAPCECAEIIDCDGMKRLWLEITKDHGKATHKKRLALRRFFEASLDPLSLDKVYCFWYAGMGSLDSMPAFIAKDRRRRLKRMPLSDDEIERVLKMCL